MKTLKLTIVALFACVVGSLGGHQLVLAEDLDKKLSEPDPKKETKKPPSKIILEGTMTIKKMGQII